MGKLEQCKQVTLNQLKNNYLTNIFSEENIRLHFSREIISCLSDDIINELSKEDIEELVDFACKNFVELIYKDNQFINFTKESLIELKYIYEILFEDIKKGKGIETVEYLHYGRLLDFLKDANSSLYFLNRNNSGRVKTFVCEEYSAEFQMRIFGINLSNIMQPFLDIGCGKNKNLINYLTKNGIECFGFDRLPSGGNIDWFEFDYGTDKWGTITSNLAFSNHFIYNFILGTEIDKYSKLYNRILNSLKEGGKWYYAPSLPFVEKFLDKNIYDIDIGMINGEFHKTVITKKIREQVFRKS